MPRSHPRGAHAIIRYPVSLFKIFPRPWDKPAIYGATPIPIFPMTVTTFLRDGITRFSSTS